MKQTKNILSWLIIALNIVGVVCLIYFAIPYFTHDVTIKNPDAMLPAEAWDNAGMELTFGLIPLLIANILCVLSIAFVAVWLNIFLTSKAFNTQ